MDVFSFKSFDVVKKQLVEELVTLVVLIVLWLWFIQDFLVKEKCEKALSSTQLCKSVCSQELFCFKKFHFATGRSISSSSNASLHPICSQPFLPPNQHQSLHPWKIYHHPRVDRRKPMMHLPIFKSEASANLSESPSNVRTFRSESVTPKESLRLHPQKLT